MSGTLFKYFDGYLRVAFHPIDHGMQPFDLVLHGDVTAETPVDDHLVKGEPVIHAMDDVTIRMWISSCLCAFPEIISWLEAITCVVQECACYWDAEGPDAELRWNGAGNSGRLRVAWTREDHEHAIRLNKAQMIRAFYQSFRSYVESDRYDALQYERLKAGETFALVLEASEFDDLPERLAALPRRVAEAVIEGMLDFAYHRNASSPRHASFAEFRERAEHRETPSPDAQRWIPLEWDHWDPAERKRDVVETIYKGGTSIAFGTKLRALRSPLIEAWLADHETA